MGFNLFMSFLKIDNIHREFVKNKNIVSALNGVSSEIKKGEMIGIIGASGAGKSTLLHIIGALDKPTKGTIFFNDKDIFKFPEGKVASFRNKKIGFVFQFHNLINAFSAVENVSLPNLISGMKKEKALKKAGEILGVLGLGSRLHHKPGELSGGEQQRVAIARAISQDPELILADEPTGNLDTKTGNEVFDILSDLNKEKKITVIVVTHNEQLSKKMPRIIRLENGKVVN